MGKRKRLSAEARKEALKLVAIAKLNDCPTSPRKMRIVADTIRGESIERALNNLAFSKKEAARKLEKLLRSAIKNWELKNEGERVESSDLYVKTVFVDEGVTLKRFQPAPMGRAYRIRKRSNHVTLVVDSRIEKVIQPFEPVEEVEAEVKTKAPAAEKKKTAKPKVAPKAAAKKETKEKAEKKTTAKPKTTKTKK